MFADVLSESRATEILQAMRGKRIVVVGDVMLDRYVWGDAFRISPEAPVPVVAAERESFRPGGAGNVAANVAALGASPLTLAVVGDDPAAEPLRRVLSEHGLDVGLLVVDPERPTTVKTRVVARHQQVVRYDLESCADLSPRVAAEVEGAVRRSIAGCDGVIVSDYGKGMMTESVLTATLEAARGRGVPVTVDPKEGHFFLYRSVTVITPNALEAGNALGRRLGDDASIEKAGRELRERLEAESVLITRGERGMSLCAADGVWHFPTVAEEVYDVTGAGDTVAGTFCLARAAGASLPECAVLANVAASLVIREVGTAVPSPEAMLAVLRGHRGRSR